MTDVTVFFSFSFFSHILKLMWFQNIFKVVRAFVRVTDVTIFFIFTDLFYFCERVWWGEIRIKKWEQLITDYCTIETSQRHHGSRELLYCNRTSSSSSSWSSSSSSPSSSSLSSRKGRYISHRLDGYSITVY